MLLGVGRDADSRGVATGVKVALFDVANAASPREITSRTFGGRGSGSGLDNSRHGINLFVRGNVTRVALPLRVFDDAGKLVSRGLQKFEVDAAARSLNVKSLIAAPQTQTQINWDLGDDRSVQIDNKVYYMSDGALVAYDW